MTGCLCGFGIGVGIYRRPPQLAPAVVDLKRLDEMSLRVRALEDQRKALTIYTGRFDMMVVPNSNVGVHTVKP
jgi:hypothetical protein